MQDGTRKTYNKPTITKRGVLAPVTAGGGITACVVCPK